MEAPSIDEMKDDPAFKVVEAFARRERQAAAGGAAAGGPAAVESEVMSDAKVKDMLAKKRVEVSAKKLAAEEEALEQRARAEQMKQFANASKAAAEAKAAERMAERADADTPEARHEALRQISLMRDMLGVPGTKRRCTADTPLQHLQTELEVMHSQANLARASNAPVEMVHHVVRAAEEVAAPLGYDFRGTAGDLEALYEASKQAKTPMERHYYEAMLQLSIKYSSWFAMGPEAFVALTIARVAQSRMALNEQHRALAGQRPADGVDLSAFERMAGVGADAAPGAEEVVESIAKGKRRGRTRRSAAESESSQ